MTTINGVTFNMVNLRPVAVHRNSVSEQPGSDTNFITDMGYDGLVLRLEGYEETLATYDSVISEFMKSGEQTLVHRTGWQFKVYSVQLSLDLIEGIVDNYFPYDLILYTSTPYRESTSETTRSKTITTNNQEWSADDSANDIDTDGSVDAVPDIQVTGDVGSVYTVSDPNPISEPGFETITDWTYSEVDTNGTLSGAQDSTYEYEGTYCYRLQLAGYFQQNDYAKITQNIDLNGIKKITFRHRKINGAFPHQQLLFQVLAGSAIIGSYGVGGTGDSGWIERSIEIDSSEQTLSFRIFSSTGAMQTVDNRNYIDAIVAYTTSPTKDPEIYNTADTTVKCVVANDILDGAVHRINADGTGHIDYDDDFSTNKYAYTAAGLLGITYDTTNDELDIADDGYIYWKCDTKGPVTGIPTLTAQINITTGTPTIQISTDGSTWYDITTAIVDDVDTVYELDSSSLHLKGNTSFYWRIDCVKAGAATCSVKSFKLNINIVTIDFEHPVITTGGSASTIRCDQDSDSSMNCTVALYYRDRSWPA